AEKAVFFFKESSCISFVGCLKRRTVDSWVWDCALLVPSKTIAITRPTENICGNSTCLKTPEQNVMGWKAKIATSCRNAFMTNILLARGSSHARGKCPPAVEINSSSTQPNRLDFLSYFE